jgi:tight adherence protein C
VEIQKRVQQTKAPLIYELKDFSKRTGISELIRVSNIIGDNINKGSSLAEKLQGESEFLWLSRKKKAEEQGRLAETKLTFPLVILLIVLIMITIAPALFDM